MEKTKKIFKEIGIALVLIVAIVILALILFVEKIPIAVNIPEPEVYAEVDRSDYAVATNGIEDAQNETVVYQSTTADLELYTDELRYTTGKTEPLTNLNSGVSDIPTDVIKTENSSATTENETDGQKTSSTQAE